MDEELERLQNFVSSKYIVGNVVPMIENIRKLIKTKKGIEMVCSLGHIMQHHIRNKEKNTINPLVNFIEVQPQKGLTKMPLDISFSQHDIIKHTPDSPLYKAGRINDKPTNEILIDHVCVKNMINEEFLFVRELNQDTYEK